MIPFRRWLPWLAPVLLAGCAATATRPPPVPAPQADWSAAAAALRSGRWADARVPLARLVQQDLRNGQLQYLFALAEESVARSGDRSRLDLAAVGYTNAIRFAPGHYWALLRLGFLELERGDTQSAQGHFAEAALDQPGRWEAFYGLGVASYYQRDALLMRIAAQHALQLAPGEPGVVRLAAFAAAATGDPAAASLLDRLQNAAGNDADGPYAIRRVAEYLGAPPALQPGPGLGGTPDPLLAAPQIPPLRVDNNGFPLQVVVEVTILLSSVLDQANRGVNLFDGLRILYGYSNSLSQIVDAVGRQSTRTITSQISVPQLDYSLNLFNDSGQHYSVVARPSITAYLGRESQFFAGRTVNVEVSGINLGQLQPVDVGVRLAVTPEAIDGRKVTFRLDAARSFLSREQIGTFNNSLTTFRQAVSATADVQFGQTLVLSALSEQVADRSFSRVPGVGEVPVLDWFTSRSQDARRQESLLILVTPTLPLGFATPDGAQVRARQAEELLDLWNERIEPRSDLPAIIERLERSRWLRKPEQGDLRLQLPASSRWRQESLEEALALAWP